jgi:cysteine desulfurase/selenocysteine lyase
VHRAVHLLAERATAGLEGAREKVRALLNAPDVREIIFVRNATEALNLVAYSWGGNNLGPGDAVVVTELEHHSNFVPWQYIARRNGAEFRMLPLDEHGDVDLSGLDEIARECNVKVVATNLVSNSLGTIQDLAPLVRWAHEHGAIFVCDAAQAAPHMQVDVQALDCDFLVATGHKLYGPTGIGVLYGKEAHLQAMPPFMGGGDMISSVTFEKSTWNVLPYKFEAGTPNIAGVIAFGAALDYVTAIGLDRIAAYEHELLGYATRRLLEIPGLRIIGTAADKAAVVSFVLADAHPHDIGTILDYEGVAVRTGHHCAQPVMDRYGVPATARASMAFYNTTEEIDVLVKGLHKVREVLGA